MSTNFQENLHTFLSEYLARYGHSPSYTEITTAMGLSQKSKSLITRSLRALQKNGKIFLKKEGRKVVITLRQKSLPLVGKISAGLPIEAIEEILFIDVKNLLEGEERFVLQVKGDSMIEEGIFDGDFIICRRTHVANEGDIVVALIDGYIATLKRISFKMRDMIVLMPANAQYDPQVYWPYQIQIQGIYIGLIRLT